jgi:hypothetical protein
MMAILATTKKIQNKKTTGAIITIWLKNGYLKKRYTYYYIFSQGEVYKKIINF